VGGRAPGYPTPMTAWLWPLLALADPPTPEPSAARQCADAANGSEIEVCLQVAATHPDQIDGVATALRGHMDRTSGADRELLLATLQLLSSSDAADGARALGALNDARAVGPLVHAARDRDEATAREAIHALGGHPEALQPLSALLMDRGLATPLRSAAASALGDVGGAESADALLASLRRGRVPSSLRAAIIATIESKFPDRVAELDRRVATDGRWWVAAGGAYSLGYALESAGYFGQTTALSPLGAVSGVAAGGTAGLLMGRAWPIEAGQAAFVTSTGVGASVAGTTLAGAFSRSPAATARIGGLIGGAAGFGTAIAFRKHHEFEPADAAEAWAVAAGGALVASTVTDAVVADRQYNWRPQQFATGAGGLIGLAIGEAVAPRVHVSPRDALMIGAFSAYGATAGAFVPVTRVRGLPVAGLASGALIGYALSPAFEAGPDVSVGALAGLTYGATLGYGLADATFAPSSVPARRAIALIGGTAGFGLGGYAAWKNTDPFDVSDGILVGLTTGWAAWQAAGWSYVAHVNTPGPALIAVSTTGIATLVVLPYLDVPGTASFAAASLGLWGGYIGVASARFLNQPVEAGLAFALVGSDIGLAFGGIVMSPIINVPPLVVGLGDAGGVLGGSIVLLGASFASSDPDVLMAASLGGTVAGFVGGAVIGHHIARSSKDIALHRIDLPGRWRLEPAVVTDGHDRGNGVRLTVDRW
jgi:hypothetical protein